MDALVELGRLDRALENLTADYRILETECDALDAANDRLLAEMDELKDENARLRALLSLAQKEI